LTQHVAVQGIDKPRIDGLPDGRNAISFEAACRKTLTLVENRLIFGVSVENRLQNLSPLDSPASQWGVRRTFNRSNSTSTGYALEGVFQVQAKLARTRANGVIYR
jgi:hypothetical protein